MTPIAFAFAHSLPELVLAQPEITQSPASASAAVPRRTEFMVGLLYQGVEPKLSLYTAAT